MAAKSDLGTLTIYMDAVTENFHKGLQGAEKAVTSFKGKIKGLNRTFTEVKSKVGVVAGAFESAFSGVEVVAKLFKGDLEGALAILKGLPLGIGAALTKFESMFLTVFDLNAEFERLEASLKRQKELYAAILKEVREQFAVIKEAKTATLAVEERLSVLREQLDKGPTAAAALERDLARATDIGPIEEKIQKAEEALSGMGRAQPGVDGKRRLTQKDVIAALVKQLEAVNKVHDAIEESVEAEAKLAAKAKDAADALRAQADNAKALLKAQNELAAAQKTRDRILGRGLQGAANTFTSPMGTISLPALNTTAELARQQLAELKTIEQTISGLETTIKDLSKP